MKTNINDFIKNHKHIKYCEAILYPDGDIEYATPSYQEKLLELYKIKYNLKDRNDIWKHINPKNYSIQYLVNEAGVISIWYNYICKPNNVEPTKEQLNSLELLLKHKILGSCKIVRNI